MVYYTIYKSQMNLGWRDKRKKEEKELLALWAEIVKRRAGFKCEYPGCYKTENLNAHHFYSRSRRSLRFDPDNGICLCPYHHSLDNDSAHKDPNFKDVILDRMGGKAIRTEEWFNIITRRAYTPVKLDLKLIRLDLENCLKKLKEDKKRLMNNI